MIDKISYRIDYTKVDEDLNNFPVCVWITTDTVPVDMFNSFFTTDTFKPTRFKVVNPITDLELYTEISYYDYNNKEMELYVKIPIIYHDKYTYLDIVPISSGTSMYVSETNKYIEIKNITGDDFTGNDGDKANTELWDTEGNFEIQSNALRTTNQVNSHFYTKCTFKYKLFSDFDIQIDFNTIVHPKTNSWVMYLYLISENGDSYLYLYEYTLGYLRYMSYSSGTQASNHGNVATSDVSGKLRITRVGSVFTSYYWHNSAWVQEESSYNLTNFSELVELRIVASNGGGNPNFTGEFDNFKINSGTVVVAYIPAQQVWDSNFKAVYHMSQDPSTGGACILDSTSNAKHGTPYGNMTSDDLVEGPVGKAIKFDGMNDYISLPPSLTGAPSESITFLYWVKTSDSSQGLLSEDEVDGKHVDLNVDGGVDHNTFRIFFDDGVNTAGITGTKVINDNVWHLLGFTRSEYTWTIWVDGIADGTIIANDVGDVFGDSQPIYLMHRPEPYFINGSVDQVQINNVVRSAAWIKATYHSLKNELIVPIYPTNCIGTVKNNNNTMLGGVKINLHRRIDGALVGTTTTTMSGTFCIGSPYVEDHYIVALSNDDNFNALIYDYINPTYSGEM